MWAILLACFIAVIDIAAGTFCGHQPAGRVKFVFGVSVTRPSPECTYCGDALAGLERWKDYANSPKSKLTTITGARLTILFKKPNQLGEEKEKAENGSLEQIKRNYELLGSYNNKRCEEKTRTGEYPDNMKYPMAALIGPFRQIWNKDAADIAKKYNLVIIFWAFEADIYDTYPGPEDGTYHNETLRLAGLTAENLKNFQGRRLSAGTCKAGDDQCWLEKLRAEQQGTIDRGLRDLSWRNAVKPRLLAQQATKCPVLQFFDQTVCKPCIESAVCRPGELAVCDGTATVNCYSNVLDINLPPVSWAEDAISRVYAKGARKFVFISIASHLTGDAYGSASECNTLLQYARTFKDIHNETEHYEMKDLEAGKAFFISMARSHVDAYVHCGRLSSMLLFAFSAKAWGLKAKAFISDRPLGFNLIGTARAFNVNYFIEPMAMKFNESKRCEIYGDFNTALKVFKDAQKNTGRKTVLCESEKIDECKQCESGNCYKLSYAYMQTAAVGALLTKAVGTSRLEDISNVITFSNHLKDQNASTFFGDMAFDKSGRRTWVPGPTSTRQFVPLALQGGMMTRYVESNISLVVDGDGPAKGGDTPLQYNVLPVLEWTEKELQVYPCLGGCELASGECLACARGKFRNASDFACRQCPAGTFADVDGLSSCRKCPVGATCDAFGPVALEHYYPIIVPLNHSSVTDSLFAKHIQCVKPHRVLNNTFFEPCLPTSVCIGGKDPCVGSNLGFLCGQCHAGETYHGPLQGIRKCRKCPQRLTILAMSVAMVIFWLFVIHVMSTEALKCATDAGSMTCCLLRTLLHHSHMLGIVLEATRLDSRLSMSIYSLPFEIFLRPFEFLQLECLRSEDSDVTGVEDYTKLNLYAVQLVLVGIAAGHVLQGLWNYAGCIVKSCLKCCRRAPRRRIPDAKDKESKLSDAPKKSHSFLSLPKTSASKDSVATDASAASGPSTGPSAGTVVESLSNVIIGKDGSEEEGSPSATEQVVRNKCLSAGCPFATTWHPHYCCMKCQNGKGHGENCDQELFYGEAKREEDWAQAGSQQSMMSVGASTTAEASQDVTRHRTNRTSVVSKDASSVPTDASKDGSMADLITRDQSRAAAASLKAGGKPPPKKKRKRRRGDKEWSKIIGPGASFVTMHEGHSLQEHLRTYVREVIVALIILYPIVLRGLRQSYACAKIDGYNPGPEPDGQDPGHRLKMSLDIICLSPEHLSMIGSAKTAYPVVFYGLPSLVMLLLFFLRNETFDLEWRTITQALFDGFLPGKAYWEVVLFFRTGIMIECAFAHSLLYRSMLMMISLAITLFVTLEVRPYEHKDRHILGCLDMAGMCTTMLAILAGMICQYEYDSNLTSLSAAVSDNEKDIILLVLMLVNACVVTYASAGIIFNMVCLRLQALVGDSELLVNGKGLAFHRFAKATFRGMNPIAYYTRADGHHFVDIAKLDEGERRFLAWALTETISAVFDSATQVHTWLLERAVHEAFSRAVQARAAFRRSLYDTYGGRVFGLVNVFGIFRMFQVTVRPPDINASREERLGRACHDMKKAGKWGSAEPEDEELTADGLTVEEFYNALSSVNVDILERHPVMHRPLREPVEEVVQKETGLPDHPALEWKQGASLAAFEDYAKSWGSLSFRYGIGSERVGKQPDEKLWNAMAEETDAFKLHSAGTMKERELEETYAMMKEEMISLKAMLHDAQAGAPDVLTDGDREFLADLALGPVPRNVPPAPCDALEALPPALADYSGRERNSAAIGGAPVTARVGESYEAVVEALVQPLPSETSEQGAVAGMASELEAY